MMDREELKASELILDLGVAIPIRPLRFLNFKGKRKNVTIRRPYLGGLIRMCQQFMELGVSYEGMKDWNMEQNITFIGEHGKKVSLLVAGAIVRGNLTYRLFGWWVAWWLRWRVHPVFISEAMFQLMDNADIRPFKNIIKLAEENNPMKPRLSH